MMTTGTNARPVVPTAVEDHDFAGSRQIGHVALKIHLRFFPLGGRRQHHDPENTRADAFGDALDHAALPGCVAPFEQHADLGAGGLHPLLQIDKLDLELLHLLLELLGAQLWLVTWRVGWLGSGNLRMNLPICLALLLLFLVAHRPIS
jgi:hypothetical protein